MMLDPSNSDAFFKILLDLMNYNYDYYCYCYHYHHLIIIVIALTIITVIPKKGRLIGGNGTSL